MSWLSRAFKKTAREVGVGLDKIGFGETAGKDIANIATSASAASLTFLGTGNPYLALAAAGATYNSLERDDERPDAIQTPAYTGLPTNFPLTAATGELKSVLGKKRERAKTTFTENLGEASVISPRLFAR